MSHSSSAGHPPQTAGRPGAGPAQACEQRGAPGQTRRHWPANLAQARARRVPFGKSGAGFTLVEIMLVVTVIGIIAAIAIPSYNNYALRAKRAEGRAALMEIAARQERYYSDNLAYATTLQQLGYPSGTVKTEGEYYSLGLLSGANQYLAMASPNFTDKECARLRIVQNNGLTRDIFGLGDAAKEAANAKMCWTK